MQKSTIEIQGNDAKLAVMRSAFLEVQFPNSPYCHFNISRGPSTQFNESFHIKNSNTLNKESLLIETQNLLSFLRFQ